MGAFSLWWEPLENCKGRRDSMWLTFSQNLFCCCGEKRQRGARTEAGAQCRTYSPWGLNQGVGIENVVRSAPTPDMLWRWSCEDVLLAAHGMWGESRMKPHLGAWVFGGAVGRSGRGESRGKDWDFIVDVVLDVFGWDISWIFRRGYWLGSWRKRSPGKRSHVKRTVEALCAGPSS